MSLVCPSCDVVPSAGAAPGSPCAVCGALLVREDAPKHEPLLLGDAPLALVDLGERTGTPPVEPKRRFTPPAEPLHPDTVNLAASDQKLELEGGWAQEKAEKVAGRTAPSPLAARVMAESRAARRHNAGLWFALVLVLAVIGAGVFLYIKASEKPSDAPASAQPAPTTPTPPATKPTKADPKPTVPDRAPPTEAPREGPLVNKLPDRGVTVRIIGLHGTPITIDGAAAGKSPVSLKRRSSTTPMTIGANGKTWKIVPDHDQTIDLSQ